MSIHHGLIHVPQIISIELPETCVRISYFERHFICDRTFPLLR
jgi:hypothetical protein